VGWSGGTDLAWSIIKVAKKHVPDKKARLKLYVGVIDAMEDHDWDTQGEAMGRDPVFDEAMLTLHPDMLEEESYDDVDVDDDA